MFSYPPKTIAMLPIAVLSRKPKKMENSGSPVIFSSPIVN